MEEIRTGERLEHRPCPEAVDVQRRVDKHLGLHGCHQIPRVQVDCWQLCATKQRAEGDSGKSALRS